MVCRILRCSFFFLFFFFRGFSEVGWDLLLVHPPDSSPILTPASKPRDVSRLSRGKPLKWQRTIPWNTRFKASWIFGIEFAWCSLAPISSFSRMLRAGRACNHPYKLVVAILLGPFKWLFCLGRCRDIYIPGADSAEYPSNQAWHLHEQAALLCTRADHALQHKIMACMRTRYVAFLKSMHQTHSWMLFLVFFLSRTVTRHRLRLDPVIFLIYADTRVLFLLVFGTCLCVYL